MPQPANKRFVMEDKLTTELALKAPIAGPTFTGTVTAPDVSVTNVATASKLRATSTSSSSASDAPFIAGSPTGAHLGISQSSISSMSDTSTFTDLNLQPAGGNITLGLGGGNVTVGTSATTATIVGSLVTATGDGTVAPLRIPAGTLMGTVTADVIETDADAFYGTANATHGRGVFATNLFSSGTATFSSTTGAQNLFPVPNDTLAMAANTTYMVEGLIHISVPATSSAAHTMSLTLNGGTASTTAQVMAFATQNNTSATAIPTAAASYLLTGTGASTIWATASTAATAVFRTVHFKGIIRCTTAGTFIPRITTSVASVAIPAGRSDNYITLTPIGSNSVTSIGAWS